MLRGREDVLSLIKRWLEGVASGAGGALHLEGAVGVGKTALLEWAAQGAAERSLRVLRVNGHPEENATAWAGLSQLVAPHLAQLAEFDDRPRDTLMRAMRLGHAGQVDDVSVGMSVLFLLTFSDEPTIVVVDDLQWLDEATSRVLRFVCRRLQSTGVGVITAQHPGSAPVTNTPISIEPLTNEAMRVIARDRGAAAAVAEVLVEHAGGLPLVLSQMVDSLDPDQRRGHSPLPEPLTQLVRVDATLARNMRALPHETQRLLAACALAPYRTSESLAAMLGLGDPLSTLAPAEAMSLIELGSNGVVFRHPTVRNAAIQAIDAPERRTLHANLAREADVQHAGWHFAAAATGPDDAAAEALDALAADAETRGASLVALRARQHAMAIAATPRPDRLLAAARNAVDARLADVAAPFLDQVGDVPEAELLRAQAAWISGDVGTARRRWSELATRDDLPTDLRSTSRRRAALAAFRMYDLPGVVSLTRTNPRAEPEPRIAGDDPLLEVMDWGAASIAGAPGAPDRLIAQARALLSRRTDHEAVAVLAEVASLALARTGRNAELSELSETISDLAHEVAADVVPALLIARASYRSRSDLVGSIALARDALSLAEEWDLHHHRPFALAIATIGEASVDGPEAASMSQAMRSYGIPVALAVADYADALVHYGRGEYAEAFTILDRLHDRSPREVSFGFYWHHDLVDIALRMEDRPRAEAVARDLEAVTASTRSPWVEAALHRAQGLLAVERTAAEQQLERSIILFSEHGYDVSAARVRLELGERLRRDRQRSSARLHIELARHALAAAGARRWVERCEREAIAVGLAPLQTASPAASLLTARELQVARWLVAGFTFKQIGTRLFLSPRTAEAHGQTVYRKLGVRGRAELAQMATRDPTLVAPEG